MNELTGLVKMLPGFPFLHLMQSYLAKVIFINVHS